MIRRRRQFARPQISALESRQLLSSTPVPPTPYIDGSGNLFVAGTTGNDKCQLSETTKAGVTTVKVALDGKTFNFAKSTITGGAIVFFGLEGNDYCYDGVKNLRLLANGGDGNDSILGNNGDDYLIGKGGNDSLMGNGGNDLLYGDWTETTSAADSGSLYQGKDTVSGGDGNDTIYGGAMEDSIDGGGGDDTEWGGSGNDTLWCGLGTNTVHGGWGNDRLNGGSGGDYLYGDEDDDILYGGAAFDFLDGGDGNDFLDAQADGGNVNGGKGVDCDANNSVINGVSFQDIFQNGSSSCWFLATLGAITTTSLTNHGNDVGNYLHYRGNGVYDVRLFNAKTKKWVVQSVNFEGAASVNAGDAQISYLGDANAANAACEGEFWATVIHRGMLSSYKVDYTDASAILNADYGLGPGAGGQTSAALKLLGMPTATFEKQDATHPFDSTFLTRMQGLLNRNGIVQPLLAGSKSAPDGKIVPSHAYQVLAIDNDGNVLVRNPWGADGGTGNDGSDDGLVVLTATEFASSFKDVAYATAALT